MRWEKLSATHITKKAAVSRTFKELQISKKKTNQPKSSGQKTYTSISHKGKNKAN